MAAEDRRDVITLRLQSKDRKTSQEINVHRVRSASSFLQHLHPPSPTRHSARVCVCVFQDTPLGSVFSQYLSRISISASTAVSFYFDGSRVRPSQTPAELDMEDGDMVEVWL